MTLTANSAKAISSMHQLHAALEQPTQTHIAVGAGSAMLVSGWCFHTQEAIRDLAVVVGGVRHRVAHQGLVRLDVRDAFPNLPWHHGHAITSGFRTTVPLPPVSAAQTLHLTLEAILETGEVLSTRILKTIVLDPSLPAISNEDVSVRDADTPPLVAICMPVYNPNPRYLALQIESIRAQTYSHWQCFIQDDASNEAAYRALLEIVGDDARFHVARNGQNLGSFNNYEATLNRVPHEVQYVTLASQDNIWHEDFLQTCIEAFTADVALVTCDMIVIDGEDQIVSSTFWEQRVFEADSLDRLLLTNTVSGAGSMFRCDLISVVLPFPPLLMDMYDDHWIALVALTQGRIGFVDRPLLRYRHHGHNVVGWPNTPPIQQAEYARLTREWTYTPDLSAIWQITGVELSYATLALSARRLWAEILKVRAPHLTAEQQSQLDWIIQMDESPRVLRRWIRERGGAPRVTVNIEWRLLYAQVVERLFRRYAREHWPFFYIRLPLTIQHPMRFQGHAATQLAMQNMIEQALATSHRTRSVSSAAERAALQHQVQQLSMWVQQVLTENAHLRSRPEYVELERIRSLRAWRAIQWWYGLKARVLPAGSRRERAYALARTSIELLTQDGIGAFTDRMRRWLRGERRYAISPDAEPQAQSDAVEMKQASAETPLVIAAPAIAVEVPELETQAPAAERVPGVLHAYLDQPRESRVEVGAGSGILLNGWAFHTQSLIRQLVVRIDGERIPAIHFPRVRRDVRDAYAEDAQRHGGVLNSGFRVIVPLEPVDAPRSIEIVLEATLETGEVVTQMLRTIDLLPYAPLHYARGNATDQPLVAICLATYNPNPRYLREQIESIRAQRYANWICLIQDDGSKEEAWTTIQALVGDDSRFQVARSSENRGVYLNFEACLRRVPSEAAYIAFCDQDDAWEPHKLDTLLANFGPDHVFLYSDHTIIDAKGKVLSETGWIERRHQESDLDRLLMVNHIAGSTCLFRAELLRVALPFPPVLADLLHDHWMAAIALTQGKIGYVDQPLIRYRQHGSNVFGWWNQPPPSPDRMATALRWWFVSSDSDKANQRFNINFEKPFWLTSIALWADVLLRRTPEMPAEIARQLQWVRRMDGNAPVLREWIRERGNVPRITINVEWHLLYNLVAEHAMTRFAQRSWQQFNFASRRPTLSNQSVPMKRSPTIDYEALRHRPRAEEAYATIPAFWKALFPPAQMMQHVQEDADPDRWLQTGREFLHYSRMLAGVQPSDAILEVGCGAGRMAMAFALYLRPGGRYEGFDIHPESIAWAQRTYKQHWPHIRFQHVDLYNRFYNPHGALESAAFRFPYSDQAFDFTLLASVFTHMLPRDVAHYWAEIARTLKVGGRALVTGFLLNDESRSRLASPHNTIALPYDLGVYRVNRLEQPERIVAYEEAFMCTLIANTGLVLDQVYDGSWCGRPNFLSYQDVMVVRRVE